MLPYVLLTLLFAAYNGNWLIYECQRSDPFVCEAYLTGYIDGNSSHLPAGITTDTLRAMVLHYLKEHPEAEKKRARTVIEQAIKTTFESLNAKKEER